MIKKENHFLFYFYFIFFLLISYIGREILSPTEHYFVLYMQIISIAILPFISRQILPISRFLAGILFFLALVMMWEITNFIPFFGLAVSVILTHYAGIVPTLEWSFVILKPLFVILFLGINANSFLLFFNALTADKEYKINSSDISFETIQSLNLKEDEMDKLYSPPFANFYFNELTQILTIFINKNATSPFKCFFSISSNNLVYFFLNRKNNFHSSHLRIVNNLLIVANKKQILIFNYKEFPLSLKDIINEIINDKN